MTDKEVYEKFMSWIGMEPSRSKQIGENTAIRYDDTGRCDVRFTKVGYELFYAGAVFDGSGKIVRAFIDSHVAYSSENSDKIDELLKD